MSFRNCNLAVFSCETERKTTPLRDGTRERLRVKIELKISGHVRSRLSRRQDRGLVCPFSVLSGVGGDLVKILIPEPAVIGR